MKKRIIIALTVVALMVSMFTIYSTANEGRASSYLSRYSAGLYRGSSTVLTLSYTVVSSASGTTRVGVSKIEVYTSSGSLYKTIYGSTGNGLIASNTSAATGTYNISCQANTSYYCVVTVMSANSSGSDYRTITTVTA